MEESLSERVKKLINKGFDIKLISFELEIPYEFVEKCNREILIEKSKEAPRPIKPVDSESFSKMREMRIKYNELYKGKAQEKDEDSKEEDSKRKTLSSEELEQAKILITSIEERTGQIASVSKGKAEDIVRAIIGDVKKLQPLRPLPIELAERLKNALDSIQYASISKDSNLNKVLFNAKRLGAERLIEAINLLQERCTDIQELTKISTMLTSEMEKANRVMVGMLKSKIQRKISGLQVKRAMDKIKNIPPNIANIAESLANGELNLAEARKIIDEEAKARVASRPHTRFSVTEEQEKGQIAIQIRTAIADNPDKYHLKDPESAIGQIQELCGGTQGENMRAVVVNLIGRKHFETAKRICRKFSGNNSDGTISIYTRRLQEDIKNAEIAEMVLRGINMNGTPEEQAAYYEAIEMGLKRGNVNFRAISLGKSQDGLRDITLADILSEEVKNR